MKNIFRKLQANENLIMVCYKFIENNCHLLLLSEFIQTQKGFPTFMAKMGILT